MFTVEPEPGSKFAVWAWTDPAQGKPVALEGDLSAAGMKFAIVVARWNAVITDRLLEGALDALLRSGAKRADIEVVRVPGAWEIPAAARTLANRRREVDAIVTLGCLLRGETAHYEAIYNEVARGIGQSQQETGIPHSFGVLTCETLEQALNRAGIKAGNKGFEAAVAAIEMVSLRRKISSKAGDKLDAPAGITRRAGASRANWPCRCCFRPTSASRRRIRCGPLLEVGRCGGCRRSAGLRKICFAWPRRARSRSTS